MKSREKESIHLIALSPNISSLEDETVTKSSAGHTVYAVISEAIKPSQLVGQEAQFKFESKIKPLPGIWRSPLVRVTSEVQICSGPSFLFIMFCCSHRAVLN